MSQWKKMFNRRKFYTVLFLENFLIDFSYVSGGSKQGSKLIRVMVTRRKQMKNNQVLLRLGSDSN